MLPTKLSVVTKTAALAFGAALALSPSLASGQMLCAERQEIMSKLQKEYKEVRNSIGLTHTGAILEVYKSPKGTWTIMVTTPETDDSGSLKSCLIAHGEDWEAMPPQIAQVGETS